MKLPQSNVLMAKSALQSLGYKLYDTTLKLVNEVMNYANQLIIYRLNIGAKAQATLASGVTAKAV